MSEESVASATPRIKRVRVQNLFHFFGNARTPALRDVTLDFERATLTGLVGGNGAGKTTLLHLLATLLALEEGSILYGKTTWKVFRRKGRRRIGWVSHDPLVYGDLTGRENLRFYATMYGLERADALCARWLETVSLTHAADRRVVTYSRGMVQRLTIARALLHDPDLVLLDEPLTGLDQAGREDMTELFLGLKASGKILVMSTHDLHSLAALCDRLAVLRSGALTLVEGVGGLPDVLGAYEKHA